MSVSCSLLDVHGCRTQARRCTGHHRLVTSSGFCPLCNATHTHAAAGSTPRPEMSAGSAPKPPGAYHGPVTMVAPGRRASHLEVVVAQASRPSRNSGKLVAEAQESQHNTMLSQGHAGRRGRSAHIAGAQSGPGLLTTLSQTRLHPLHYKSCAPLVCVSCVI